jgi:hypothetical protein
MTSLAEEKRKGDPRTQEVQTSRTWSLGSRKKLEQWRLELV